MGFSSRTACLSRLFVMHVVELPALPGRLQPSEQHSRGHDHWRGSGVEQIAVAGDDQVGAHNSGESDEVLVARVPQLPCSRRRVVVLFARTDDRVEERFRCVGCDEGLELGAGENAGELRDQCGRDDEPESAGSPARTTAALTPDGLITADTKTFGSTTTRSTTTLVGARRAGRAPRPRPAPSPRRQKAWCRQPPRAGRP